MHHTYFLNNKKPFIYSNVVGLIKDEKNTYFNTKRNTDWSVTISDQKSKNSYALINILKYALKSYFIREFLYLFFEINLQL